jgi:anti-sigma regulatory factor (Ser/Thr protein kinase)
VTAVFDASADQVQYARHFAEAMLRDWPLADEAALVVSEFSANAVSHSASGGKGKFWVHLEAYPGHYAWVEVRDPGGPWISREHRDGRPHGLDIVGMFAADHGVDGDERSGWIAWARLELPEPGAEPA